MTNLFLKINKDFFNLKLNPTEMIILAQVMEFHTNNKVCYMTNQQFAEMLFISERTVSRAISKLEDDGYITITSPRSRNRTLLFNKEKVEEKLRQNVQDESSTKEHRQNVQVNIDNLSNQHRQNDFIKDNKKINLKDKREAEIHPSSVGLISSSETTAQNDGFVF